MRIAAGDYAIGPYRVVDRTNVVNGGRWHVRYLGHLVHVAPTLREARHWAIDNAPLASASP